MRRPRSGIGIELVSVALILSCLAGSMALVVAVHRQNVPKKVGTPVVAVALPPPAPEPTKPAPVPVVEPVEPDPPTALPPVDPTPAALAVLTSHEAEQLLETSKADRRTAALEAARREALLESERLRRRESLVHAQLSSLDSKVRKLETEADTLALERDALLRERDARKALAARARSRPAQAILPHKGPNGTWRRPIVIECRDGMAVLQPEGRGFGLMELDTSFGPISNPFTAAVAREAIRIQGKSTPDGKPVVPYIFFVVRPDGIRPYYEARGRLEALGITFGYELADQDWQIDFPDLDDPATWDGSAPARPSGEPPFASNPPPTSTGNSNESDEFPTWNGARGAGRPGAGIDARGRATGGSGGDSPWAPAAPYLRGNGPAGRFGGNGANKGAGDLAQIAGFGGDPLGNEPDAGPIGVPSTGPDDARTGDRSFAALGGSGRSQPDRVGPTGKEIVGLDGTLTGMGDRSGVAEATGVPPTGRGERSQTPLTGTSPSNPLVPDETEPGSDFVWDGKNKTAGKPGRGGQDQAHAQPIAQDSPSGAPDRSAKAGPPPFDPTAPSGGPDNGSMDGDPTQPGGSGSSADNRAGSASKAQAGSSNAQLGKQGDAKTSQRVLGPGTAPPGVTAPPPGMTGVSMTSPPPVLPSPGMPIPKLPDLGSGASMARSPLIPEMPTSIIDRTYEIVVVCGPRGVIVQPGGYRVTADALKDRDGLLKKQIVALIKAKRASEPRVVLEPSVRFLVQSGGSGTYRAARGQFMLSGLDYPVSMQVADPDPVSILPSEGW